MKEKLNIKIKENKSLFLLIAVALETLIAIFGASHIYFRKPIGVVLGTLLILTAFLNMKHSLRDSKGEKLLELFLGVDGVVIFFGAILRRAKIMEYALIVAVVFGIIYLVISIVRAVKGKVGNKQIGASVLCMAVVLCGLVFWGNRMITSAIISVGAEAYDNSVDFGVSGQWITIDRENEHSIRAIVNRPRTTLEDNLPAVVFTHGGSWVGGTAMDYDDYC